MSELPFINDPIDFCKELKRLRILREAGKGKSKRGYVLTKTERKLIYEKTDGKCHVCGDEVSVDKFEADHVKSHSKGGTSLLDNFLPTCKTCNNYRWDYLPDEVKWILKLGVWGRTEIEKESKIGKEISRMFISYEDRREQRRKNPRNA